MKTQIIAFIKKYAIHFVYLGVLGTFLTLFAFMFRYTPLTSAGEPIQAFDNFSHKLCIVRPLYRPACSEDALEAWKKEESDREIERRRKWEEKEKSDQEMRSNQE
jgi:hypothetical protein